MRIRKRKKKIGKFVSDFYVFEGVSDLIWMGRFGDGGRDLVLEWDVICVCYGFGVNMCLGWKGVLNGFGDCFFLFWFFKWSCSKFWVSYSNGSWELRFFVFSVF